MGKGDPGRTGICGKGIFWIFIALGWAALASLYLVFRQTLAEAILHGDIFCFLHPYFTQRSGVSTDQWQGKFDRLTAILFAMSAALILFAFAARGLWRSIGANIERLLLRRFAWKESVRACMTACHLTSLELLGAATLTIGLGLLYFFLGLEWSRMSGYFQHQNILFGADHLEAIELWYRGGKEIAKFHTGSHPLLPLFVTPILSAAYWINSNPFANVLGLVASAGAISVAFVMLIARILGRSTHLGVIGGLLFATTMSQLVFSAVPETYAMAGLSVVISFVLLAVSLKHRHLMFPIWVVVGIVSFGLLITNVFQTMICFAIATRQVAAREDRRSIILAYVATVGVAVVTLSLLQRIIFPGAELFFIPTAMLTPTEYIGVNSLGGWRIVSEIWTNMGFLSIVGCIPAISTNSPGVKSLSYFGGWQASPFAISSAVGFIGLFFVSLRSWAKASSDRPLASALLLTFGLNVVIHLFYGTNELFLYSCNYTFLIVALVIFAPATQHLWYRIGLMLVVGSLFINNVITLHNLLLMIR